MVQTAFHRRVPASHRLRMLAAAAMAALALSACGGGGGGGSGPPVVSGGGGASSLAPSSTPSAGGVTAQLRWTGSTVIGVVKGDDPWTNDASTVQPAPTTGWTAATKQDRAGNNATELFRVVTNFDASEEDYLAYGYWSRSGSHLVGLNDYKPFYYGDMLYTGNVREQTGIASYTGGATGVYRTDVTPGATAVAGHFTADVAIAVTFGTTTDAAQLAFAMRNIETLTSGGATGPTLSDTGSNALTADAAGSSFTGIRGRAVHLQPGARVPSTQAGTSGL